MSADRRRYRTKPQEKGRSMLWTMLRGVLAGVAAEGFVLGLGALAISKGALRMEMAEYLSVVACLVGGGVAGAVSIKGVHQKRLICGAGAGGMLLLTITAICSMLLKTVPDNGQWAITAAACICGGGIVGAIPVRTKGKRK